MILAEAAGPQGLLHKRHDQYLALNNCLQRRPDKKSLSSCALDEILHDKEEPLKSQIICLYDWSHKLLSCCYLYITPLLYIKIHMERTFFSFNSSCHPSAPDCLWICDLFSEPQRLEMYSHTVLFIIVIFRVLCTCKSSSWSSPTSAGVTELKGRTDAV